MWDGTVWMCMYIYMYIYIDLSWADIPNQELSVQAFLHSTLYPVGTSTVLVSLSGCPLSIENNRVECLRIINASFVRLLMPHSTGMYLVSATEAFCIATSPWAVTAL